MTSKQNFFQQKALTAANIHDATKPAEVVSFKYRLSFRTRVSRHRAIENSLFFRVLSAVGPSIYPMGKPDCTFSRFDAVQQITPRCPLAGCTNPAGVVAS